jgi:hypothetical protein
MYEMYAILHKNIAHIPNILCVGNFYIKMIYNVYVDYACTEKALGPRSALAPPERCQVRIEEHNLVEEQVTPDLLCRPLAEIPAPLAGCCKVRAVKITEFGQ